MKELIAYLGDGNMGNRLESGGGDSIYDQTREARRVPTDVEKSSVHLDIQDGEKQQFYMNIAKEGNRKPNMTDHL